MDQALHLIYLVAASIWVGEKLESAMDTGSAMAAMGIFGRFFLGVVVVGWGSFLMNLLGKGNRSLDSFLLFVHMTAACAALWVTLRHDLQAFESDPEAIATTAVLVIVSFVRLLYRAGSMVKSRRIASNWPNSHNGG